MMIIEKHLRVEMPDGSKFDIPVREIAINRANAFRKEFDNSVIISLLKDTVPFFENDPAEIFDWASNNMSWEDVADAAVEVPRAEIRSTDYQKGWVNGDKEIVEPVAMTSPGA